MKSILVILLGLMFLLPASCFSQERTVKGKVTDGKGNPLPGVTIMEKASHNGTVTDASGNFSITVHSAGAVIVVTYLGFAAKEFSTSDQSSLDIVLESSTHLKYWCCTDHPAPNGPHCGLDKAALTKAFGCKNFERE